jgi:hypothetical protein
MLPSRAKVLVAVAGVAALAVSATLPAQATSGVSQAAARSDQSSRLVTVSDDLTGPRGLAVINKRKVIVGQADGTISRVVRKHGVTKVVDFAHVPPSGTGVGPAVARGLHGTIWIVTGGAAPDTPGPAAPGAATLYKWRPHHGAPKAFADIGAYQKTDPDPYNQADDPGESNPFGVAALPDGSVLVSDAAANDLLRVKKNHKIQTVARLKPRMVAWPAGLPFGPPAGTVTPAEAVATSVTVKDGAWFVGELRGVPATPGTSEIWKIKPGSRNAVCDPEHPRAGHCKRYADGLTSIVDLAPAKHGLYALELSKMSFLALESGAPGSTTGALYKVRHNHIGRELAKGKLTLPGGVDRRKGALFVTGPQIPNPAFGPGKLFQIR